MEREIVDVERKWDWESLSDPRYWREWWYYRTWYREEDAYEWAWVVPFTVKDVEFEVRGIRGEDRVAIKEFIANTFAASVGQDVAVRSRQDAERYFKGWVIAAREMPGWSREAALTMDYIRENWDAVRRASGYYISLSPASVGDLIEYAVERGLAVTPREQWEAEARQLISRISQLEDKNYRAIAMNLYFISKASGDPNVRELYRLAERMSRERTGK